MLSLLSFLIALLLFLLDWVNANVFQANGHRISAGLFFLTLGVILERIPVNQPIINGWYRRP